MKLENNLLMPKCYLFLFYTPLFLIFTLSSCGQKQIQKQPQLDTKPLVNDALSWAPNSLQDPISISIWKALQTSDETIPTKVLNQALTHRMLGILNYSSSEAQKENILGLDIRDVTWELNIGKATTVIKLSEETDFKIDTALFQQNGYHKGDIDHGTFYFTDKKGLAQIENKTLRHAYIETIVWLNDEKVLLIGPLFQIKTIIEAAPTKFVESFDLSESLDALENPTMISIEKPKWRFQNFFYFLEKLGAKPPSYDPSDNLSKFKYKRALLEKATTVSADELSELQEYAAMILSVNAAQETTEIILHYNEKENAAKDFDVRVKIEKDGYSFISNQLISKSTPLKESELRNKDIVLTLETPKGIRKRLTARDFLCAMNL